MNLLEVSEALLYGDQHNEGDLPLFSEGRNTAKWEEIRNSHFYKDYLDEILADGEKYLSEPIHSLRFSDYKLFDTSGERTGFEVKYFDRRERLNTFAILSMAHCTPKH